MSSPASYHDHTYRDAAVTYWGEAGAYAHDRYTEIRKAWFPILPEQLPIVIGIPAYGHCLGLTRTDWSIGPRITLGSNLFAKGHRWVDDTLIGEVQRGVQHLVDERVGHRSEAWYESVRRLSPSVLGHPLNVIRGADRRSVRVPNPVYEPGNGQPKTLARKERVPDAIPHSHVARWPRAFRPDDYDWGHPIPCPSY